MLQVRTFVVTNLCLLGLITNRPVWSPVQLMCVLGIIYNSHLHKPHF